MKALTFTQPWATLVAEGAKRIETRSWSTHYRGPLLIHAAKGWQAEDEDFAIALHGLPGIAPRVLQTYPGDLPRGAVVARCRLVNVVRVEALTAGGLQDPERWPLTDLERELGDYSDGRFGWLLDDVEPIDPPMVARGALGLWEGPDL